MQIEIHGEAEQLLKAALASGQFASVSDFITAMAAAASLNQHATSSSEVEMPDSIDVDDLANSQGVGELKDFRDLKADFWPDDTTAEEFLHGIRDGREASNQIRTR